MEEAYLLLGSNLGESKKYISDAIDYIEKQVGSVTAKSSLYQTASWGKTDQPDFINQVVRVETSLDPQQLLENILVIEKKLGRERTEKWGSRTIDIDLLLFGDQIVKEDNLVVPHPYLHERRFTLMPLMEIDAGLRHPVFKETVSQLYSKLKDNLSVIKI
jgi:2-amino-4-hydroxy-6-hydroxymethyldihydropteridine diphosphokinase